MSKYLQPERYIDLSVKKSALSTSFSWQRNVRDCYQNSTEKEIQTDLRTRSLPFAVLISQVEGDFNCGTIIRTANNFLASEIFYFGKRHLDRRSAVGSYKYSPTIYLSNFEEILALKNTYTFVALENNLPNTQALPSFVWPKRPLIICGEENSGLIPELLKLADYAVEIPTMGSVRSLNVGCAAGIAMFDFYSKWQIKQ